MGSSAPRTCRECGAQLVPDVRYCGECGSPAIDVSQRRATVRQTRPQPNKTTGGRPPPSVSSYSLVQPRTPTQQIPAARPTDRNAVGRPPPPPVPNSVRGNAPSAPGGLPAGAAAPGPAHPVATATGPMPSGTMGSNTPTLTSVERVRRAPPPGAPSFGPPPSPSAPPPVATPLPSPDPPPVSAAPTTPVMARTGPPEPTPSMRAMAAVEPIGPEGRSEFQRLLEEVESGFDAIVSSPTPPVGDVSRTGPPSRKHTGEIPMDATLARALFDSMVAEHATPVRDFMIEVRLGEPVRTWIDFALPAVKTITRSAEGMALEDFTSRLARFSEALVNASASGETLIRGENRQAIIDRYNELITYLPEAFALEVESNKRESVIVHALLQQVDGLSMVGIDRIYAAGLTSLALYYVARASDIAEIAGLSSEIADQIIARFLAYRERTETISPEQNREQEVHRVRDITDELERLTVRYDAMAEDETPAATRERREIRKQRTVLGHELELFMARLGEIDRLRALERKPFAARIAALREYVHGALHVRSERHPPSEKSKRIPGGS